MSCAKKTTVVPDVVPVVEEVQLLKTDSVIKSDSGNLIIAVSFGNLIVSNRIIYKRITIANNTDQVKKIPKNIDLISKSLAFSIDPNTQDSSCLIKDVLKSYEKCTLKINLDQSVIGSFTNFIYLGKLVIPVFANITDIPQVTCTDGYHLNTSSNLCENDIIQCPYIYMPDGANSATQEWDYATKTYLPSPTTCYIKDCNYLTHNTIIDSLTGLKSCQLKQFNINVINSNLNYGMVVSEISGGLLNNDITCGTICDYNFNIRSNISLNANAFPGYSFDHWEGTSCNGFTTPQCLVSYLSKDQLVIAKFVEQAPVISSITVNGIKGYQNDIFNINVDHFNLQIDGTNLKQFQYSEGGNCIDGSYLTYNGLSLNFTLAMAQKNKKNNFSIKFKNDQKETECFNFYIAHDDVKPIITITSPLKFAYFGPYKDLLLNGTCEPGLDIKVSGNFTDKVFPCVTGLFSISLNDSLLTDGLQEIRLKQTDLASNSTEIIETYTYDKTPPTIPSGLTMASSTLNRNVSPLFSFIGSTDINLVSYEVAIGNSDGGTNILDWVSIPSISNNQVSFLNPLQDNTTYYLSVRSSDSLGNKSNFISQTFVYSDLWITSPKLKQFIKTSSNINNSNFGSTIKYNKTYKTLFSKGKSSAGKDAVYIFELNTITGLYSQTQIIEYPFIDSDGFGDSMSTVGDYLFVGASLEDSSSLAYSSNNTNNLTDSGIVYIYKRSNGIWSYDNVIKSSYIGSGNKFGYKVFSNEAGDGLFVLSINDFNRGSGTTSTQGFVEYYQKISTGWQYVSNYKISNLQLIGDGKNIINIAYKNPYLVLTQQNSSSKNNTIYILKLSSDYSTFTLNKTIRANQYTTGTTDGCTRTTSGLIALSNYNFGNYLEFDYKTGLLYTNSIGTGTLSGSYTDQIQRRCDFELKLDSINDFNNFSEKDILGVSSLSLAKQKIALIGNDYIISSINWKHSGIIDDMTNISKLNRINPILMDIDNVNSISILKAYSTSVEPYIITSSTITYPYLNSDINSIDGDENNIIISNPSHSYCTTQTAGTTCPNSGAIFYFTRF